MALIAIIFGDDECGDLVVGGISVLERQRRLVRRAHAERIIVIGPGGDSPALLGSPALLASPATAFADDDRVLVLARGLVIDERIVDQLAALPAPSVAYWPAADAEQRGVERIDPERLAAGVALYSGAMVRAVAAGLGDWDLHSTLLRTSLADPAIGFVDLAAIDLYAPGRRRNVPLLWAMPTDLAGARRSTDAVVAASQKGCLDWPAAYLHPPIENACVRLLAPTPITPNMVTIVVVLIGIAAGVAFATGWLWTGLGLALLSGPLDGVDGKLARTRIEFSRFGDLEHILDKICEYGWYLCIAFHLSRTAGHSGPWTLAIFIILFALAESLQGEFYRRFTGAQLDDAGDIERRFRIISGRRNTFFWCLVPFAAFGAWQGGFMMIASYSAITFFVMQYRLFIRLRDFASAQSPRIAANFKRTSYDFLPGAKRSAR